MAKLLVGAALALLFGCGGCGAGVRGDDTFRAKNQYGEDVICRQEYPTGSHIGRTVCRTPQQEFDDRERARDLVSRPAPMPLRRPPPPPPGT